MGEFAVEVFETPVCEKCRLEDEVAGGGRAVGSDGCGDFRAVGTVRGVGALEVKGGRKSMSRRQRGGAGAQGVDMQICPSDRSITNPPVSPPTTTASSIPTSSPRPPPPASTSTLHSPPTPYVSIFDPLNTPAFKPTSRSKKPPNWLAVRLPSGLEASTPRPRSKLSREVLVGSPEPVGGDDGGGNAGDLAVKKRRRSGGEGPRKSAPVVSFAQDPRGEVSISAARQSDARKKIRSRKATPIPASLVHHKPHNGAAAKEPAPATSIPYPFFQNPRRPIIPAVESTWSSNKLSPGLFPYAEEHSSGAHDTSPSPRKGAAAATTASATATTPATQKGVISSFRSTEYLDRYRDTARPHTTGTPPAAALVCSCCSEPIAAGALSVAAGNGYTYHEGCFRCRGCRGAVDAKGAECVVLGGAPWHRGCVRPVRHQQQQQQQQQVASGRRGAPPRAGKGGASGGLGLGLGMSGFFSAVRGSGSGGGNSSARKPAPPPPPPPPPSSSLLATFDDSCAGCGTAFPPPGSSPPEDQPVPGPRDTAFHRKCLRCRRCEGRLKAGNRWYEWDGRGLMGVLCR
ncbi:MAG: hypothetical protein M1839_000696 [Geoglossum umbratile]|nr:MAG: hypothetical protein M1839_000696 [Geoglossum umbratile]